MKNSPNNKTAITYTAGNILALLTIIFIGLKLGGYIAWSWWWVLSPILIPLGIISSVGIIAVVLFSVARPL